MPWCRKSLRLEWLQMNPTQVEGLGTRLLQNPSHMIQFDLKLAPNIQLGSSRRGLNLAASITSTHHHIQAQCLKVKEYGEFSAGFSH